MVGQWTGRDGSRHRRVTDRPVVRKGRCFSFLNNFLVLFIAGGVELADGTQVAVNHALPHTYRISSTANSPIYDLYVDGVLVATATATAIVTGENAFAVGDSNPGGSSGWDVDVDYWTYLQGTVSVLPGIGAIMLLATVLGAVGAGSMLTLKGRQSSLA